MLPSTLFPKYGILKIYQLNDLHVAQFVHGSSNETQHKTHNLITTIPIMHLNCGHINHKHDFLF